MIILGVETEPPRDGHESGGDPQPTIVIVTERLVSFGNQVSGQLVQQESIIGQVVVERVNHPVAVLVRKRRRKVRRLTGRIGVTNHVQPVASPADAVLRRFQQTINDSPKRPGLFVRDERPHVCRRGRQPGQVERRSPNQRSPIGLGSRIEARQFQTILHKPVNVVSDAESVSVRRLGISDRLKRPETPFGFGDRSSPQPGTAIGQHHSLRPGGSVPNPSLQIGNFQATQFCFGRHFHFALATNRLHQPTPRRIPGHDHSATIAAPEQASLRIKPQAALSLLRTVALHTPGDQQWPDPVLEECQRIGIGLAA